MATSTLRKECPTIHVGTTRAGAWQTMAGEMKVDDEDRLYGARRQLTLANGLRLLLGLWVMDAPFVYSLAGISAATVWNSLIVGGCVVMLATMRLVFVREARAFRIAHLLLGVWLAASPWLFGYTDDALLFWNSVICGLSIAALAVWSLLRYRDT